MTLKNKKGTNKQHMAEIINLNAGIKIPLDSDSYESVDECEDEGYEYKKLPVQRMTLLLDLDNTLIHSSLSCESSFDFSVDIDDEKQPGKTIPIYIQKRPFLQEFLQCIHQYANVYIYTAAERSYAEQVKSYIDPFDEYFSGWFYRDSCILLNDVLIKRIDIAKSNMQKTILIDDSIDSFGGQLDNCIKIPPYCGGDSDHELVTLALILEKLSAMTDVRPTLHYINHSLWELEKKKY